MKDFLEIIYKLYAISEFFEKIIAFIIFLSIPVVLKKYRDREFTRKILHIKDKVLIVSLPIYETDFTNFDYPIITLEEVKILFKLQQKLNKLKIDVVLAENNQIINHKNILFIGGPAANVNVNTLFKEHFNNRVKFKGEVSDDYFQGSNINTLNLDLGQNKYGIRIGRNFFPYKDGIQDYAFIVKFVKTDFDVGERETVFVIFGIEIYGAKRAFEYLIASSKQLYKRFHNDHFFIGFKINLVDMSIDEKVGIIDFTDDVFEKKK